MFIILGMVFIQKQINLSRLCTDLITNAKIFTLWSYMKNNLYIFQYIFHTKSSGNKDCNHTTKKSFYFKKW